MAKIVSAKLCMVDLVPETKRTDSIQSFISQETPILRLMDSDGVEGVGYTYTIGTGGSSVVKLLEDHLLPQLLGRNPDEIERIWRDLKFSTNATFVGPITALALACIDTALWDMRCKRHRIPLYLAAGGAKDRAPAYTTECGWLHIDKKELVDGVLEAKEQGFHGAKIKVGKPHVSEDIERLEAVREAVGRRWEIMTDCNQAFTISEAIRRASQFEKFDLAWLEEPLLAEDLAGHIRLSNATNIPIAVGESLYSIHHFREYMQQSACSVVQVDVARIGGITPWLKVAHAAETFNVDVSPHFLMELHVSLVCAVPNGRWVEYIPQLNSLVREKMVVQDGFAIAPRLDGIGIDWDWDAIKRSRINDHQVVIAA